MASKIILLVLVFTLTFNIFIDQIQCQDFTNSFHRNHGQLLARAPQWLGFEELSSYFDQSMIRDIMRYSPSRCFVKIAFHTLVASFSKIQVKAMFYEDWAQKVTSFCCNMDVVEKNVLAAAEKFCNKEETKSFFEAYESMAQPVLDTFCEEAECGVKSSFILG